MSAWKEIGEIGKTIIKGTAVMVGTKRLASWADRAIPAAAQKSQKVWKRVKSTKSTGKKKKSKEEEDDNLFKDDDEQVEKKPRHAMYDAEFEDKNEG